MKTVYKVVTNELQSAIISDGCKIQYKIKEWVKEQRMFCFLSLKNAQNFVALNGSGRNLMIYRASAIGVRPLRYISPWYDSNTIKHFWNSKNKKKFSFNTEAPEGTYICNAIRLEYGPL